jgi:hypothetical protein
VFLIYFLLDSRFPYGAPYTEAEKAMSKNFMEMYYTFATSNRPAFGLSTFGTIQNGDKRMINEITRASLVAYKEIDEDFGNADFWNNMG